MVEGWAEVLRPAPPTFPAPAPDLERAPRLVTVAGSWACE